MHPEPKDTTRLSMWKTPMSKSPIWRKSSLIITVSIDPSDPAPTEIGPESASVVVSAIAATSNDLTAQPNSLGIEAIILSSFQLCLSFSPHLEPRAHRDLQLRHPPVRSRSTAELWS